MDSGYHIVPPQADPRKFGQKVTRILCATGADIDLQYLVSEDTLNKEAGFYIGDTDNYFCLQSCSILF